MALTSCSSYYVTKPGNKEIGFITKRFDSVEGQQNLQLCHPLFCHHFPFQTLYYKLQNYTTEYSNNSNIFVFFSFNFTPDFFNFQKNIHYP